MLLGDRVMRFYKAPQCCQETESFDFTKLQNFAKIQNMWFSKAPQCGKETESCDLQSFKMLLKDRNKGK